MDIDLDNLDAELLRIFSDPVLRAEAERRIMEFEKEYEVENGTLDEEKKETFVVILLLLMQVFPDCEIEYDSPDEKRNLHTIRIETGSTIAEIPSDKQHYFAQAVEYADEFGISSEWSPGDSLMWSFSIEDMYK